MFVQTQYAFNDIKTNLRTYLSLFIQLAVSLVLFALVLNQFLGMNTFKAKITSLNKYENIHLMIDITEENYLHTNVLIAEDAIPRMEKLYDYLCTNTTFKTFSYYEQPVFSTTFDEINLMEEVFPNNEGGYYGGLYVNPNFLSIFKLDTENGRLFEPKEYVSTDEIIPVVLGSAYRSFFSPGDMFSENMKVIGILPDNAFYISPKAGSDILLFEKIVLMPMNMTLNSSLADYDNAINSTCIITDKKSDLDDIQSFSNELNLFTYRFRSFKSQLDFIIRDYMRLIQIIITLLFLILFFCIMTIISNLLNFIQSHKREFAIHLMCGATMTSFVKRIVIQIGTILLFSNFLTIIIFRDWIVIVGTVIFSIFIASLILSLPILSLFKQNVNDMVKIVE